MARRLIPRSRGAQIFAALLFAVVVAEAAVLLLAPSGPELDPAPIDASAYVPPGELERGADYGQGQRWIGLGSLGVELTFLALLATLGMRRADRFLERLPGGRLVGAAVTAVAIVVALSMVTLIPNLWAHERAVDFGISTQSLGSWLSDRALALAITGAMVAIGGAVLIALQRRLPRAWVAPATLVVVAFAVLQSWLAPVVLAPAFNDFERLDAGPIREDVVELAASAGVEIDGVYRVDASRRGNAFNAYVSGLGSTRRVVLYDNLLDGADRDALRSVVAHELGHVSGRDIPRGIAFVAVVAPFGLLLVRLTGDALLARAGLGPGRAVAIVPYALGLAVVSLGLGIIGNQLSRAVERRADLFALELTQSPAGFVCLQQRIAAANLSEADPPGVWQFLFSTHPTKVERLGAAEAFAEGRGLPAPSPTTCRADAEPAAGSG